MLTGKDELASLVVNCNPCRHEAALPLRCKFDYFKSGIRCLQNASHLLDLVVRISFEWIVASNFQTNAGTGFCSCFAGHNFSEALLSGE